MTEMQSADKRRAERDLSKQWRSTRPVVSGIPMHAVGDFRCSYHDRLGRFDYYVIRAVNARGRRVCHFDLPFVPISLPIA